MARVNLGFFEVAVGEDMGLLDSEEEIEKIVLGVLTKDLPSDLFDLFGEETEDRGESLAIIHGARQIAPGEELA